MRLDKFLKVSRIIKRRPVAKKISNQGRILINDKVSKSASQVNSNDKVTIKFGNKTLVVRANELQDTTKKSVSNQMYTVLDESYKRDYNNESY